MTRWVTARQREQGQRAMGEVMAEQVDALRAQMVSAVTTYELRPDDPSALGDGDPSRIIVLEAFRSHASLCAVGPAPRLRRG